MGDDELERFVASWMARKRRTYVETEVWAGAGDKGRDVACYRTSQRLEGPWDLMQCKQLTRSTLSLPAALTELGKLFHHAAEGSYPLPERYVFVAPRNVSRPLKEMIAAPSKLRQAVLDGWDEHCAGRIAKGQTIPLSSTLRSLIERYDFGRVSASDALRMLEDEDAVATMVEFFGHDPGDWSPGEIPAASQPDEAIYLRQLVDAYGERSGLSFSAVEDVAAHGEHRDHLADQRVRFFHAAFFKRHYRDNTPERMLVDFEDEIYHGVVDTYREPAQDTLTRIDKVMTQANAVRPGGVLGLHGRVQVRQGICHHLVNEKRLTWKR